MKTIRNKGQWFALSLVLSGIFLWSSVSYAATWNYMNETSIRWFSFGDKAFAKARKSGKPVYVFVFADWCNWCKKFETEALETPTIRALIEKEFVPVAIDFTKFPDLAKQVGTIGVPTNVLYTPEGKKLLRFFGYIGPKDLEEIFLKTLDRWRRGELPEEDEFGN